MKKALVFVVAFTLVLVAGAAFAFMATPGDDTPAGNETIEKPSTPTTLEPEEEKPSVQVEVKEEPQQEEAKHEEDPPKEEESHQEEVKEEEDTTSPDLVILFPEDGQHFDHKEIAFEGKTEPHARVFAGDYEADVDEEGNWRIVLFLSKGGNTASFKAIDEAGNTSTASVQAFYDAPEEEPKDEPKEEEEPKGEYDFTAHQKFGSCGEDVPYDIWSGTGTPGTEIWIGNDWGSATTTIGDGGEWYLKVTFPEMPCGTHSVVLETNDGDRKTYEFTRVCDEGGDEVDGEEDK
ncbi:MAG: hypothetical protein O6923_07205 [Actinobacteria bacterium]|nr:hypothetical protein [Actinomycetota bacterium]